MATISDDGKWMWNGDEWIPAPPTSETETNSPNNSIQQSQNMNHSPQIVQQPLTISVQQPKSKGIAFILNFLIPGIGHMYLENTDRGLPVAIISLVCAIIIIGIPVSIVLWIWMLIDTSKQYEAYLVQYGSVSNQINSNQ